MIPDISRLAQHSVLNARDFQQEIMLRTSRFSEFEHSVLNVVLEIADAGVNRTAAAPQIVHALTDLSRTIAATQSVVPKESSNARASR